MARQGAGVRERSPRSSISDTGSATVNVHEYGGISTEDESNRSARSNQRMRSTQIAHKKGSQKRKRTPTPPRTLPPHEQYFFQTRPTADKTSSNTFPATSLLSHKEYVDAMKQYDEPHQQELGFLHDMHCESFDQWLFELHEGYNICLYGWGSKRKVLLEFADYVAKQDEAVPTVIVVNGFMARATIREILEALAGSVQSLKGAKLPSHPLDAAHMIISTLSNIHTNGHIKPRHLLLVHSLDTIALRQSLVQSVLAYIVKYPFISIVATCDTMNFPLMWDASLQARFNWVFHDTTTFTSFDTEIDGRLYAADGETEGAVQGAGAVDQVNVLLGKSGRSVQGREGVVFVLRSLTESARRLYELMATEVLCAEDGVNGSVTCAGATGDSDGMKYLPQSAIAGRRERTTSTYDVISGTSGVKMEYRTLYRKAVQSLIATSEVQFRQLLKEFYDHEMLVNKKDSMGTELLGLPFRRDELESILEGMVLDE